MEYEKRESGKFLKFIGVFGCIIGTVLLGTKSWDLGVMILIISFLVFVAGRAFD